MACSIIQILRSIINGRVPLRTLGEVELLCDSSGEVIYSVGNSAILFSFWYHQRRYRLKCYTSKSSRRTLIYGSKLLVDELYVPHEGERGEWIDILLEPWIEGATLTQCIEQHATNCARDELLSLSKRFDALALDLLSQEWAHGDITCENIIVDNEGELHLIDHDANYIPQFEGLESHELGTAAYQHPLRSVSHFDRSIDDYSLALISTSLSLLAIEPQLYDYQQGLDGLLLEPLEIMQERSAIYTEALQLLAKRGEPISYNIAKLLRSQEVTLPTLPRLLRYKVEGAHLSATPTTIFCRDGLWGYLNQFGREVIPPLFDFALDFSESLAAVRISSWWHYIDSRARVVVNCSDYISLKSVSQGRGRAQTKSGQWQEIDIK
ncbi:MAG: WG repeat-containing protein [Rikenellaceae bacterium]